MKRMTHPEAAMTTDFDLTDPATFAHWTPVTIRYSDQDAMAHINNVAIAQYVEAGRTAYFYELIQRAGMEGLEFILANLSINYLQELHYPGVVDVGGRLMRLGTKSMTTGFGIFKEGECYATATSVNVFYDLATRRSTLPPDSVRAQLAEELAGAQT
jgi:acyl-CoA thioester hydrolase